MLQVVVQAEDRDLDQVPKLWLTPPFMDGPPLPPAPVYDASAQERKERTMQIMIVGIDLGKNSCSLVGLDESGMVVVRKRLRRDGVIGFAAKLSPCVIAMEACCGAHHMGRSLAALGHEVRLMSPEYVRPYVK